MRIVYNKMVEWGIYADWKEWMEEHCVFHDSSMVNTEVYLIMEFIISTCRPKPEWAYDIVLNLFKLIAPPIARHASWQKRKTRTG